MKSSEITLKTNETGTIQILSDEFCQKFKPCTIYINNIQNTPIINKYDFNQQTNGINTVRISWNVKINTTDSMFENCYKIVEIDLSKFKTKYVTNMGYLFSECKFLKSINLLNIDTSKVTIFASMFSYCYSLTSLDLSKFNTTKVSIFPAMFLECPNLLYINFKQLNSSKCTFSDVMFNYANEKLIACSKNEDKLLSKFFSETKDIYCHYYNIITTNKCYSKKTAFDYQYICDICGKNYVRKNEDNLQINCFEEIKGYYLDESDWKYKK